MRDLQADLELCKKATPGPWKNIQDEDPNDVRVCQIENNICICCLALMGNYDYEKGEWFKEDEEQWENDANFIAEAREGWPEAIERAIKAEDFIEKHQLGITFQEIENLRESVRCCASCETKAENRSRGNGVLVPTNKLKNMHNVIAHLTEENDLQRASIQELSKQVAKLQLTLQEIANPIKFLQQRADEQGVKLNGLFAINLATDAGYLKGLAKKALAETEVRP